MTALGYALLGMGSLFVWSGITNPPGGLWGEFGRVISGQQPAGHVGTGPTGSWGADTAAAQAENGGGDWGATGTTASAAGAKAIAFAKTQLGKPYQWGGTGPDAWDCSGLTQAAFRAAGVSLPRTSELQSATGQAIAAKDASAGDLVCFGPAPGAAHHIGIYLGNNQLIHAPSTGGHVEIIAVWNTEPNFYRRVA